MAEAYDGLTQSSRELEEAQRIGGIGSCIGRRHRRGRLVAPDVRDPRRGSGTAGSALNDALATASHPEDAPLVNAARNQALIDHQPFTVAARVVHRNGDIRHTVTRAEVIVDEDGAVTGMRGTTQDVTDQRRAAAAISAAHQEVLRQQMALAEEHRLKETLQRAVLPASLPVGTG